MKTKYSVFDILLIAAVVWGLCKMWALTAALNHVSDVLAR